MNYMFRDLTADEVECRIATIKNSGLSLLLYKNARVDQDILDETVGAMNWQRKHTRENANCIVEIWDNEKGQWIAKEDTGTESFTEKEKGLASDSFKRACFNWGIGRELYTSPFIWITKCEITDNNGKKACFDKFEVTNIKIENKVITELEITNKTTGVICFDWDKKASKIKEPIKDELVSDTEAKVIYKALMKKLGTTDEVLAYLDSKYGIDNTNQLLKSQYVEIVKEFK